MAKRAMAAVAVLLAWAAAGHVRAGDAREGMKSGTPEVRSAGPLAFGPDGVLFLADPASAAVFAIDVGDAGTPRVGKVKVEGIDKKIAAALGTSPDQILIEDMAASPTTGAIYLSVSRGRGPAAKPVLLRVAGGREPAIEEVQLENVRFAKLSLTNPPEDAGDSRRNQRRESITDLAFVDGRLIVAGLSNEEFASKLRAFPFPFDEAGAGTSVEIFHGSHGKLETRSPVRTFVPLEIDGKPHIVAAYTCTPLVTFPVAALEPGAKVRGRTVAELGNRNRPLDMISYTRDGKGYILMANNARGVMRIPTAGIGEAEGIEKPVAGTAGMSFETVTGLDGVTQLDKVDDSLVAMITEKDGRSDLVTIATP